MNARELKTILEHVPDDLPVVIQVGRGLQAGACVHVDLVRRRTKLDGVNRPWPASLVLSGTTQWNHDPPPFHVEGTFRRGAALLEALGFDA